VCPACFAAFDRRWPVWRCAGGSVPLLSSLIVGALIMISPLLFSKLMQRLGDLQITTVLYAIGDRGRTAIRELFPPITETSPPGDEPGGGAVMP
jgi:hypothetical protein